MMEKGTELKLLVTYPDEGKAVFKPMRYVDPFLLLVHTWQSPIINCSLDEKFDIAVFIINHYMPGRLAQSVGHLIRKSEVLGSVPDLATYFRFSFL